MDARGVTVTLEIVLLAVATAIRPTSLAATYVLLSGTEPRRLMIAYVVAGLSFTVAFGALATVLFDGFSLGQGGSTAKAVASIAGGTIMLVFAILVHRGRIGRRGGGDAPHAHGNWQQMLERRRTVRTAAVAGPFTHLPGLFYLVALNLIVADKPSTAVGALELLVYNAIWFALPIAALAICIVRPSAARDAIAAVNDWTRRHARELLSGVALVIGAVLVVRGLVLA